MESEEEGQWSWWQQHGGPEAPAAPTRAPILDDPADDQGQRGSGPSPTSTGEHSSDSVRRGLIGLVAALSVALAGVSYARFTNDNPVSGAAAVATTVVTPTTATTAEPDRAPTSAFSTTTAAATSVPSITSSAGATTTTTFLEFSGPPSPPQDVTVFSTSSTGAEIRWRSEQCVGSRYQVGDFEAGGGGFPNVDRCWFNHVVLPGEPDFSPPLSPGTSYTVTIQAVGPDGTTSEPVVVEFTTTS